MRLIDTHTHAWGENTAELPWIAADTPPGWEGPYTHRDLVADMDRVGVDESVVVSMPLYGRERGNEYLLRCLEAHPERLYGVGFMDFFGGDIRDRLRKIVAHPRMLGVRLYAAFEYATVPRTVDRRADWILDSDLEPFFAAAAELDTTLFVFPKAQQLRVVEAVVSAHPDVQFVIDHMAWIDETVSRGGTAWQSFKPLAESDNVFVKLSSLPRSSERGWPYEDLHPYVHDLVEWFGTDRLVLGSDYPWMDSWASYENCLDWIDTLDWLSSNDRSQLQYRTFDRSIA